jgi:glycosyltransferase involved in cell wall biosynthesis
MFEYMAGSKPVVANEEIPEHKEVLSESGGGILTPFIPEAFADAIIELLESPEKANEMGRRGREWVSNNRSYEVLAQQVEVTYFSLAATKH